MLDREERAYLRAHGKLRVLVVANERPYAYLNENGQLAGAMKVVTDRLASDLGIETEAQENLLRRCGCEYGQGYLYGKPMPRAEFETFLRQHA